MAGEWIKLRDLRNHPHVKVIAARLKVSRHHVIGALTGLWHDADAHAVGNVLPGLTAEVIDADAEIDGFAAELQRVGWLELNDNGAVLPRYEEHNGSTAKNRAVTAKRVGRHRSGNAGVTTAPLPDKKRDREEKKTSPQTPLRGAGDGESTVSPEESGQGANDVEQAFDDRIREIEQRRGSHVTHGPPESPVPVGPTPGILDPRGEDLAWAQDAVCFPLALTPSRPRCASVLAIARAVGRDAARARIAEAAAEGKTDPVAFVAKVVAGEQGEQHLLRNGNRATGPPRNGRPAPMSAKRTRPDD